MPDNQNYSSTSKSLGGFDEANRRLVEGAKLTTMSAFRKLAEDRGFDLDAGPGDDHIRAPAVCPRCEWDMALWGESVYDLTTGKHIAVENLVRRLIPQEAQ